MSQLRKEYKEFKQFQEDIFKEAAEAWTEENVILINERLNRNAIYRLNSAIERFDNKFGPYKDKLPAIADILNNAENGLHLVITGKVGSRTTAQMLQRMSIMYNILSNFFSGDLGALLKTPAFRIAHEQADEKIDKIADRGHDIKAIRRTIASALKPNDQERMLFRRAYKSFDMPSLDWNMAAKQLSCLSCNELQELAGIQRVPMVVVDEEESGMNERRSGGYGSAASNTASTVAGTVVGGGIAAAVGGGIAGGKALANRFKGPTPQDIAEMNKYLKKIEATIPNVPETAKLLQGLKALEANIKKAEGGQKFAGWNPLRNPTQRAISQGKQIIDIFEKLGLSWAASKGKYKDPLSDEDTKNIEKMLLTQVNGVGQKLGRLFKTNLPAGLTAKDIVNGLVALAKKPSEETPSTQEPVKENRLNKLFSEISNMHVLSESLKYQFDLLEEFETFVKNSILTEGFSDLDSMLTKFVGIKTNIDDKLEKQEKEATSGTAGTTQPVQSGDVKKAVVDPTKAAETESAKENDIAPEDIDAAISATTRATEQEIGKEKLDALNKAIVALQIPNVNDATSASKFLTTYKSLLAKDLEIGNLINILANNVPQPAKIQEQRNVAIKIIKRIILEAGAGGPAVVAQRIIPVGAPATAPAPTTTAEITTTSLDQAENNATAIQDNPQVASAIASQIKALEIPGITDVASVAKFINDYMSVIGKMKEVKQLLALLKDVSDVKKYPKVTPAPAPAPAPTAPA